MSMTHTQWKHTKSLYDYNIQWKMKILKHYHGAVINEREKSVDL